MLVKISSRNVALASFPFGSLTSPRPFSPSPSAVLRLERSHVGSSPHGSKRRRVCPRLILPRFLDRAWLGLLGQRGPSCASSVKLTPLNTCRTKCLRDIILDKRGPLTKALDKVKAVCEKCAAEKEWNAYEDYMLACLYNQADAYDQKQPITIPAHNQICGALNITRRWESHRNVVKNLIREIDEISETIKKKQQRTTKQQWHDVAVSVLVCRSNAATTALRD